MYQALPALSPIHFFQVSAEAKRLPDQSFPSIGKKEHTEYLLPDVASFEEGKKIGSVSMGWSLEGIEFRLESPLCADLRFEVCIDTRDVKTSGYNTQYCHVFYAIPASFEGKSAEEITRFRTEDAHVLCDPFDLKVAATKNSLNFFIPRNCLNGYDPNQFDRMGMTYRILSEKHGKQHFSVNSDEVEWAEQPALWSTLTLKTH